MSSECSCLKYVDRFSSPFDILPADNTFGFGGFVGQIYGARCPLNLFFASNDFVIVSFVGIANISALFLLQKVSYISSSYVVSPCFKEIHNGQPLLSIPHNF